MISTLFALVSVICLFVWSLEKCLGAQNPQTGVHVRELGITVLLILLVGVFIVNSVIPFTREARYVFGW